MKIKLSFLFLVVWFIISSSFPLRAQKTRWPVGIEGSSFGIGVPVVSTYGYNRCAVTSLKENIEGKHVKKRTKPAEIHFRYDGFDASQLVITETYNPGAISKVVIGYSQKSSGNCIKKVVWVGNAMATEPSYTVRNFHFDLTPTITDVWVTIDYSAVAGLNQLGGACLVNSTTDYIPRMNLPEKEYFTTVVRRVNDDVNGEMNPKGLILSADGRYIYFSNEEIDYDKIYRGEFDSAKELKKVTFSKFNLPVDKSRANGLIGISQDNNVAYVSDMFTDNFHFYEVYQGKSLFGKPKWKYELKKIENYKNGGVYIDFVMSYDGRIIILGYKEKSKHGNTYNEDLYVSLKDDGVKWTPFKHMGFDLNTTGSETPSFLASDNKTLYFVSTGRIGYGSGDIYVSKLLDDTWTNWSEPVNLGPNVNSSGNETSFVIDPFSGRSFFIRWDNEEKSNIYSIDLYIEPKANEMQEKVAVDNPSADTLRNIEAAIDTTSLAIKLEEAGEVLPEPVIIVSGVTANRKTNEPIHSEILYHDITTGAQIGNALSNAETGEYSIILRKGTFYSFEAKAEGFISESFSLNTVFLQDFGNIEQNFMLSPIEKDQTIRLNNLFFETDKAELLSASFLELEKLVALLNRNKKIKIEIGGHTDDVGSESYNQLLSQHRAENVVNFLISKGISSERIIAKGYGESKWYVPNVSDENRALNRRVEFTLLEVE